MPSREIISNQTGCHDGLAACVQKHLATPFLKPPSDHTKAAFETMQEAIPPGTPLIFDSGCGTGDSTRRLSRLYPECFVVGVDRSLSRLSRIRDKTDPDNMVLIRADLIDLYGLMTAQGTKLERHFIFYPNPYPKAAHLKRRWHGTPVFPAMLALGGKIELRSNWEIYVREFAMALTIAGRKAHVSELQKSEDYASLFEKKYALSGQTLWQVTSAL